MSSFENTTVPGSTLDAIKLDEYHLHSFIGMVMEKLAIDKRHLNDLKSLETIWDPNWTKSSIWPLVSPLLSYFEAEKSHLEQSIQELVPILAELQRAPSPHNLYPENNVNKVKVAHQEVKRERRIVRQIEAHNVSRWRSEAKKPRDCLLLEQDRNYRRAVWNQINVAEWTTNWYDTVMPAVLEDHQQRAEDVKSGIQTILTRYRQVFIHKPSQL